MDQQEAIREIKVICIDIAASFEVAPALVEIVLIRRLAETKKLWPVIPQYLRDCHLARLLRNQKGTFLVTLESPQPTIKFNDGVYVARTKRRKTTDKNPGWSDFAKLIQLKPISDLNSQIKMDLNRRMKTLPYFSSH